MHLRRWVGGITDVVKRDGELLRCFMDDFLCRDGAEFFVWASKVGSIFNGLDGRLSAVFWKV